MRRRWGEPLAVAVGSAALRLLAATWRVRERGAEHMRALRATGRPFVVVLWHSGLLPLLYHHRHWQVVLLISRHRDGGHLAALAERWGYRSVRGSTRRGGDIGLRAVVRSLREGAMVAITPDGPRGPAEVVQPGAVAAAQHAGVPVLPVGARPSAAWRARSWDRFAVPKPFATIDVIYGPPLDVRGGPEGLRQGIADVQHALDEITHAA